MFAVIKTGGKQYKVAAEDKITVMTLPGEAGAKIVFGEVLALFDGAVSHVGAPHVVGASVVGEIVEQTRGPKVYAFKKPGARIRSASADTGRTSRWCG